MLPANLNHVRKTFLRVTFMSKTYPKVSIERRIDSVFASYWYQTKQDDTVHSYHIKSPRLDYFWVNQIREPLNKVK